MNKINITKTLKNLFINKKDELFIIDSISEKSYTYSVFFNLVLSIFEYLKENKINTGDRVSFICENSVYSLALYIASLLNGSIIAPIDSTKGKQEIENLIKLTNPKIVIKLDDLKNILYKANNYSEEIFKNIDTERPYLITFTSGSTGDSKGVVHSFKNLFLSATDFGNRFNLSDKNVFYHNFPMAYMAGILNLFIKPMIFGCKIVISERLSVATAMNFWQKIIKYNVNSFWFNPTFVSILMKLDRGQDGVDYCKSKAITACIGTAPLDINLKNKFENKYGFSLFESYGLSETLFLTTNYPENNQSGSVGKLLPSVKMNIGEDGEIQIKTPWLLLKYLDSNTNENQYFSTGDLGTIEEDYLIISGRKKDIIIKGGVNISPKKIEKFISKDFDDAVIIGVKDKILGEKIACFYTGNLIGLEGKKQINSNIINALGNDYSIDLFKNLSEIPININGKIDKLKIKKEYENDN